MTVQFQSSTAIISKSISTSERRLAGVLTVVLVVCFLASLWFGSPAWSVLFWIGAGFGVMASFGLLAAMAPDRRYVFDAASGMLNIGRRYPWQDRKTIMTVPFSAI